MALQIFGAPQPVKKVGTLEEVADTKEATQGLTASAGQLKAAEDKDKKDEETN